ncbi:MAG: hypothetical protein FWG21_06440, partial [Oscillospiraceae bacterium]|nr:hypothetical protein [Oscillospiraceae bacterium]
MRFIVNRKPIRYIILAVVLAAVYTLLSNHFFKIAVISSLKFILFMIVFLLPGIVLHKGLRLKSTPLEALVYTFTLSFIYMFLLYLMFALLGLMSLLALIPLLMLLFGVVGLLITRAQPLYTKTDSKEFFLAVVLAVISLALVMFFLTAANASPAIDGPRQYHVDLLNSVGLVTSASKTFPFEDVKAIGINYTYHALPFAFLAVMKSVTGFSSFDLITDYSLTVFTPFCVLALAALIKRVAKNNLSIIISFVLLFILSPFENRFTYYMYSDTLGFSLAIALGAVSLLTFIDSFENQTKGFSSVFLLCCLSFALTVAAKGPIAVIYLFGFGVTLLFRLFKKEERKSVVFRGIMLLLSFVIPYFLIYSNDAASLVLWYPGRFVYDTDVFLIVKNLLGHQSVGLTIVAMQLTSYCLMSLAVICLVVLVVVSTRKDKVYVIFSLAVTVFGSFLTYLTHQYGGSEIYFILSAYAFCVIAISIYISHILKKEKRRLVRLIPVLTIILLSIIGSFSQTVNNFSDGYEAATHYTPGSPGR